MPGRRSADEWVKVIARYRRSGLTQREFCEREGVSAASLQHWCQGPAQLIALSSAELIADVGHGDLDLTGFARIESQLG